ncbi:MAG: hypothetical protein CMJ78_17220 [Planctomycetaceae bacterium]|nr:hypothetical protein [Planctomycetaceae bacterium]
MQLSVRSRIATGISITAVFGALVLAFSPDRMTIPHVTLEKVGNRVVADALNSRLQSIAMTYGGPRTQISMPNELRSMRLKDLRLFRVNVRYRSPRRSPFSPTGFTRQLNVIVNRVSGKTWVIQVEDGGMVGDFLADQDLVLAKASDAKRVGDLLESIRILQKPFGSARQESKELWRFPLDARTYLEITVDKNNLLSGAQLRRL